MIYEDNVPLLNRDENKTIYPTTSTKSVWDQNGNRLDNTLDTLNTNLGNKVDKIYVDTKFGSMGNTKIFKGSCTSTELSTKTGMVVDDYWYISDLNTNKCYNGTSWVDIGNYLNIADNTMTEDKSTYFDKYSSKNLLNTSNLADGYVDNNGTFTSSTSYKYTNYFIPVTSGNIVVISNSKGNGASMRFIAAYNNNKVVVPASGISSAVTTYTVPTGIYYIKVSILNTYLATGITQIEITSNGTATDIELYYAPYYKFKTAYINDQISMFNMLAMQSPNLLNPSSILVNKLVSGDGVTDSTTYNSTDFISVKKGHTYCIVGTVRLVEFYFLDKTFKTSLTTVSATNYVFTPTIDGYIRFAYLNTYSIQQIYMIEASSANGATYTPYGYILGHDVYLNDIQKQDIISLAKNSKLYQKVMLNVGDSIAAADTQIGYAQAIADANSMTRYDYSQGGARFARHSSDVAGTRQCILNQIDEFYNAYPSVVPDIILLEGLANDCYNSLYPATNKMPIGTVSSGYDASLDEYTSAGAFESIIKTLKNRYPATPIIFIFCHKMLSRIDLFPEYYDMARIVVDKWNVDRVDLWNEGGLNTCIPLHLTNYTLSGQTTGTHPNTLGYSKFYVPRITSKAVSLL